MDIKIPTVGESVSEVTIGKWQKNDGDHVEADEVLVEIESDKASFELNAEEAGVLHIQAKEGSTVAVGDTIASIDTSARQEAGSAKKEEKQPEAKPEAKTNGQTTEKKQAAEKQPAEKEYASKY